jgi:RNA polymerase sigma factor (sigma-70 family)
LTKEELQEYRPIKTELEALTVMLRKITPGTDEADSLTKYYNEKKKRLTERLQQLEDALNGLTPTERTIMRLRYIDGLSWLAVSRRVHYSKSQVRRHHVKALDKLKDR